MAAKVAIPVHTVKMDTDSRKDIEGPDFEIEMRRGHKGWEAYIYIQRDNRLWQYKTANCYGDKAEAEKKVWAAYRKCLRQPELMMFCGYMPQ
jgi:hypothetical protein